MYSYKDYENDLKIVNAVIKKYFYKYKNEFEDLRQIGLVGIVRSKLYYNCLVSKPITYLWNGCYMEILNYLKHNSNVSHQHLSVSLNDYLSTKDEKTTLEDVIEDTYSFDDIDDNIVIIDTIKQYFKEYQNKKSNAFKISKYTILGYSSKEIMEKLGVSVSYINRVKQEFLAKLKIMLKKELHDYDR